MGKQTAYQIVEKALYQAIMRNSEVFTLSSLDGLTDPTQLVTETKAQLGYVRFLARSLETHVRFHQGRALAMTGDLDLTKHEKHTATNVYRLFRGFEWLVQNYSGSPTDIDKLTEGEIIQLRGLLQDPINDELEAILDFDAYE